MRCYFTELLLYWAVTLRSCYFTELLLYWAVTLLNCYFTELLLYWAVTLLSCYLTELLLYWAVTLLSCYLSELLLYWAVTLLSCYFTELFAFLNLHNSEVSQLNFLWWRSNNTISQTPLEQKASAYSQDASSKSAICKGTEHCVCQEKWRYGARHILIISKAWKRGKVCQPIPFRNFLLGLLQCAKNIFFEKHPCKCYRFVKKFHPISWDHTIISKLHFM